MVNGILMMVNGILMMVNGILINGMLMGFSWDFNGLIMVSNS